MKAIALSAACVAAWSVGCAEQTQPPPGEDLRVAPPTVWSRPVDLATAVSRDVHPGFDVRHDGFAVGPALGALAARLSLRTWPELDAVASSVVAQDADPGARSDAGSPKEARIDVIPSVPLGERWYALVMDELPAGLHWPLFQTRIPLPSGTLVSRFKTASAPFVAGVQFCAEPADTKVILYFSEFVLASGATIAQAEKISQPGHPDVRCTLFEPDGPFVAGSVEHVCLLDPAAPVSISLAPLLASAAGKSVAPFSGTFVPDDLVNTGTCRIFKAAGSASDPLP